MPERSTTDAIFIARQVMEKYREKRRPCYIAFLDLEKAFDRLPRQVLWRALQKRKVPEHLISLVKVMYDGSTTTIRTPHGQTGAIDVTVGVHQGSALSLFLFLLTMDVITEELMDGPLKTILYADDIALIAESKDELQDKLQNWQRVLAESGLRLNVKKTKFLSSEEGTESIVDGRGEARVHRYPLRPSVLQDPERKVYRTVVRPTMLYGSECWPVSKSHEGQQRLRWFGHVLRRPQSHPIREAMELEAQGKRPRGAQRRDSGT
ncbi:hypothetical protein V3C99_018363 [Haemonchus contortus]|uniref:Reverse transcriptase domain-containing protein n=1 Tax=Haemonchus contortus TaxID=6289 RepID=A0A7I4Z0V3_HAECO